MASNIITLNTILIVILGLYLVSKAVSEMGNKREEGAPFECGFELSSEIRLPFSMAYFMVAMVFLLFDLEVMYLVYAPYIAHMSSPLSGLIVLYFLVALLGGLLYEWHIGGLDWSL